MKRFDTAARGAVMIGGRDNTRHTKRFSSTETIVAVDDTHMQPEGDAMNFIAGLETAAISISGSLPVSKALVELEMRKALGLMRNAEPLLLAPWGTVPGHYAEFLDTEQTRFGSDGLTPSITAYNADFIGTGGLKRGTILHTSQGTAGVTQNEIYAINFVSADPNQFFGARAVGTTEVFEFTTSTTNAQWKAGLEALPAYAGRTVTVTGSLTGISLKSGIRLAEFSGGSEVPAIEIISGAVRRALVIGGDADADYSFGGGDAFALGISQADFQANQRATGGAFGNVVAIGSSAANNASGELHNLIATNALANATIYGDVTVTPGMTADALEDAIQAKGGTYANRTVSGSSTAPVASTIVGSGADSQIGNRTFTYDGGSDTFLGGEVSSLPTVAYWDSGDLRWKIRHGAQVYYLNSGTQSKAAGPTPNWTVHPDLAFGLFAAPTTVYTAGTGSNGSYTVTIPAGLGDVANLAVVGDGWSANSTPPAPKNGTLDFKIYFHVGDNPGINSHPASGTGATNTTLVVAGSIATTITPEVTQAGGTFTGNIITGAFNGTWVDLGAITGDDTTNDGGAVIIQVPFTSPNCNATVRVQHADDNGSGAPGSATSVAVFDVITQNGAQFLIIPRGTICKQWVRVAISSGQITGQIAFTAAICRNSII
jgi:hypothetical protein